MRWLHVAGPSSAQSSTTYAKVSDLTIDQNSTEAPLAPPVDDLSHLGAQGNVHSMYAASICYSACVDIMHLAAAVPAYMV